MSYTISLFAYALDRPWVPVSTIDRKDGEVAMEGFNYVSAAIDSNYTAPEDVVPSYPKVVNADIDVQQNQHNVHSTLSYELVLTSWGVCVGFYFR